MNKIKNFNRRIPLLLFILLLTAPFGLFAQQAPSIEWQRCFGGTDDENVQSGANRSIIQTSDGGYAFCGETRSHDGDVSGHHGDSTNIYDDVWVVKLNSLGVLQWQKCLGGSSEDRASCIVQTTDGGFVIAGTTSSNDGDVSGNHGGDDAWVLKLDSIGKVQWQSCFGGLSDEQGYSIIQTSAGDYVLAGTELSTDEGFFNHGNGVSIDAYIVRLSSSGSLIWQKCFGGSAPDAAYSIIQASDGGFAFVGYTNSNNGDVSGRHGDSTNIGRDIWVVKLDSLGTLQWQKCLGGFEDDWASSIIQIADSSFIIAGSTNSNDGDISGNHGGRDAWVVKLNSLGAIQWQKCFGGTYDDQVFSVIHTSDDGFFMAGSTKSNDGEVLGHHGDSTNHHDDVWVVKLTSIGDVEWQKCLGGTIDDEGVSVIQSTGGEYTIHGMTTSNDGDVTGNHGNSDLWVVKLKATQNKVENANPYLGPTDFFQIYPNPSLDQVRLQLWVTNTVRQVEFYDLMGKRFFPPYDLNSNIATVNLHNVPAGAYINRITFSYKDYVGAFTLPLIVQH